MPILSHIYLHLKKIKQKMEKIQDNRKAKQKWKYKKIYILKKKKEKNKGKEHRTTEKQSKNINI